MPHYTGFKLGRYRLGREKPDGSFYRYWHEPGARNQSRKTLGTSDEEEAKIELAAVVLAEGDPTADPRAGSAPADLALITVFHHYWDNHCEGKAFKGEAERCGNLVLDYLTEALGRVPVVADLTKTRQRAYMEYAAAEKGHSVNTNRITMAYLSAALNFAAEEQIIVDVNGKEREVRLLQAAPKIHYGMDYISKVTDTPLPKKRDSMIELEDLARFIEDIPADQDPLFRYVVLALNTWARPSTIVELGPAMLDREYWLLDMLPEGRRQTRKRRPIVAVSKNLRAWIEYWETADVAEAARLTEQRRKKSSLPNKTFKPPRTFVHHHCRSIKDMKSRFYTHRNAVDIEEGEEVRRYPSSITRYGLRHLMATVAKNSRRPRVPKEQRDVMMGHADPERRVADGYGIYEPDFLKEAVQATDAFIARVNEAIRARARAEGRHPKRTLTAPKPLPTQKTEREAVSGKSLKIVG